MNFYRYLWIFILIINYSIYSQSIDSNFTLVIDPGHGGKDPGNTGNGYLEKKIALSIGLKIGERLKKLGKNRQVLVVTHSPQVASLGVHHFLVKKELINNITSINVIKIEGNDKTNEIARMLSGKQITNEAIEAAKKLIES